jgi:hypothetical protein
MVGIAYAAAVGILLLALATTVWVALGVTIVAAGFLAFAWATK